jgi:glutamate synthase (NADPH/NADH) small chain
VRLLENAAPKAFVRDAAGTLTSVEFVDGRSVPADLAIVAIGQSKRGDVATLFAGVEVDAKGLVKVEEATGRTGNAKVFAGGDALGGELVVTAVQDGKRAARGICKSLGIKVRPDAAMRAGHV